MDYSTQAYASQERAYLEPPQYSATRLYRCQYNGCAIYAGDAYFEVDDHEGIICNDCLDCIPLGKFGDFLVNISARDILELEGYVFRTA